VISSGEGLPKVQLTRAQWARLIVVGILAAFSIARVAPDAIRVAKPLGLFGYITDRNGVVLQTPRDVPKGSERLKVGDRVRIDRIKPFDRKPGLAGGGFTRENFDRRLPIERNGKERIVHLKAVPEPIQTRIGTLLRIGIYVAAVAIGSILFLVKPAIPTFGFFIFCLGGEYPTTFSDVALDNPWRQIPLWIGDTIRGSARAGLLLFALGLVVESPPLQRLFAVVLGTAGLVIGTLHAYATWLLTFAGRPAASVDRVYGECSGVLTSLTVVAFAAALLRTRGIARQRTGYIVAAFLFAGAMRLLSDAFFPRYIPFWLNSALVTTTIVPIVVVWIAVIRHHYFDVDWVVSRAVVYTAVTGALVGTLTAVEEIGTYIFYNNTDLAYGFLIAMSMMLGAFTGKIKQFFDRIVDRFVFRDRQAQRAALELIAGYILDAETTEDVWRALLEDATHALKLSFAGILTRDADGSFVLQQGHNWPSNFVVRLLPEDALTRAITRSRGALAFTGKESRLIRNAFPQERLTFAAPIFLERDVVAVVVYGHNVMGLDLDPDERELLVRVVAHASIALTAIELAKYRSQRAIPAFGG
jgi:hypothetical protein